MRRRTIIPLVALLPLWSGPVLGETLDDFENSSFFIEDTVVDSSEVKHQTVAVGSSKIWNARSTNVGLISGSGSVSADVANTPGDDAIEAHFTEGVTGVMYVDYAFYAGFGYTYGDTRDRFVIDVSIAPATGGTLTLLKEDIFGVPYWFTQAITGPGKYEVPFSALGNWPIAQRIVVSIEEDLPTPSARDYAIKRIYIAPDYEGDRCATHGASLGTTELAGQADFTFDIGTETPDDTQTSLVVQESAGPQKAAVVQFDLSEIPTGSLIGDVEFEADVLSTGGIWPDAFLLPGTGDIDPTLADWTNGQATDLVGPTGFEFGVPWTLTEPLRCWLQAQIDLGTPWVALTFAYPESISGGHARQFASSRYGIPSYRPVLRIELQEPPPVPALPFGPWPLAGALALAGVAWLSTHSRTRH